MCSGALLESLGALHEAIGLRDRRERKTVFRVSYFAEKNIEHLQALALDPETTPEERRLFDRLILGFSHIAKAGSQLHFYITDGGEKRLTRYETHLQATREIVAEVTELPADRAW